MGLFSGNKSSVQNTSQNYDQRKNDEVNSGIGGNIEDALVYSGIDGDLLQIESHETLDESISIVDFSEVDSSIQLDESINITDFSDKDSSVDNSVASYSYDSYDRSIEGDDVFKDITGGVHFTDGGAFDLAQKAVDSALMLSEKSVVALGSVKKEAISQNSVNENLILGAVLTGTLGLIYGGVKMVEAYNS